MNQGNGTGDAHPRRARIVLTTKIKKAICEEVGTCEYCGARSPPEVLETVQFGMLSSAPNRPDENPAKSVIVLCQKHSRQVQEGTIPKSVLKGIAAQRPDKLKRVVRTLMQKADRTYDGTHVRKFRNPVVFGVGAFAKDKPGHRR